MQPPVDEQTSALADPVGIEEATLEDQAIDAWLRAVVGRGDLSVASMAHAMQADGFGEHEAHLLAALGMLRHDAAPLRRALERSRLQEAVWNVIRHFGEARRGALGAGGSPVDAPLAPSQVQGARTRLTCTTPDLALFDDVLTAEECEGLIDHARSRLCTSRVMGDLGEVVDVDARSSSGCFLEAGSIALLDVIEARIAAMVRWPRACMENLAIVRYASGERFLSHHDYFDPLDLQNNREALEQSGQRIGTVLLYLNEVTAGGATRFDIAGLELQPRRGSALYFAYRLPDGSMDEAALHGGTPVLEGEKWIATLWLRERPCRRTG